MASLVSAVTDCPAVTQHGVAGIEVNLANRRQVGSRICKTASAAAEVDFVFGYGEESRCDEYAMDGGRIDRKCLPVVRNPVVLHGNAGEIWLALRIWTPSAPFKSPVATPRVVGLPSITPKPPRLVRIAPPTAEQVLAKALVLSKASNRAT